MTSTKEIVVWSIMIYDGTKPNPLPLQPKSYLLDWSIVPAHEMAELRALIDAHDRRTSAPAPIGGETVMTLGWTILKSPSPRLLHFRRYFVERSAAEIQREI